MSIRTIARVGLRLLSMSFMQHAAYRKSFVLAVIGKTLRAIVVLIFFQAIYLQVSHIGDWSRNDILILLAVFLSFESLIIVTFHRNLAYAFPDYVRKGAFDTFLVQPLPVLPHVAFRIIDSMDMVSTVPVIALWAYLFSTHIIRTNANSFLLFVLAFTLAIVFAFSLSTIFAAVSFWSVSQSGLGRLYEQLLRSGRYPINALGGVQGFLLTYILPFAIVGTIPAEALRNVLQWQTITGAGIATVCIAVFARVLWNRGLRRYSSASS